MSKQTNSAAVVILAAGHGTRMKSELPKVMHTLHGKPLIDHMVSMAEGAALSHKPVVVVSPTGDLIREHLGERVDYAVQTEQLGTGHAVASARPVLEGAVENVVVVYADLPFLKSSSVRRLVDSHTASENTITMLTTTVPHFEQEWEPMYSFGRIIRDESGNVQSITEMKDCTEEQREGRELNTGLYCFNAEWLWAHVDSLTADNAQQEYYLTDLIAMALAEGKGVATVDLDPQESFGISSQEDLQKAHQL